MSTVIGKIRDGVKIVGFGVGLTENTRRAEHLSRLGRGNEGNVGCKNCVPFPYTEHHAGKLQRIGAVGSSDAMLAADKVGKLRFQILDVFAADKLH